MKNPLNSELRNRKVEEDELGYWIMTIAMFVLGVFILFLILVK